MEQVRELRSAAELYSGRVDIPNLYVQMMFLVSTFWIVMIIVGSPFSYLVYSGEDSNLLRQQDCFQPFVLFAVFI